jgi:hypothetical protein
MAWYEDPVQFSIVVTVIAATLMLLYKLFKRFL